MQRYERCYPWLVKRSPMILTSRNDASPAFSLIGRLYIYDHLIQ